MLLIPYSSLILLSNTSNNLLLSKFNGFTNSIVSSINYCFTKSSNIVSRAKLGDEFTSNNEHFPLSSIMMSYPNSSKAFGLYGMSC